MTACGNLDKFLPLAKDVHRNIGVTFIPGPQLSKGVVPGGEYIPLFGQKKCVIQATGDLHNLAPHVAEIQGLEALNLC